MLCQLIEASLQQAPKLRESIDMEDPVQRSITNGLVSGTFVFLMEHGTYLHFVIGSKRII